VCSLYGCLPGVRRKHDLQEAAQPTAAFAVAQLVAGGEVLGLEAKTTYAETMLEGCNWSEWLTFCVKVGLGNSVNSPWQYASRPASSAAVGVDAAGWVTDHSNKAQHTCPRFLNRMLPRSC
jgi:hypothetical protein